MSGGEQTSEVKASEEQKAALGMEAKRSVSEKIHAKVKAQIEKNDVSKDMMRAYDAVSARTKEGSFRRAVRDKLRPIAEVRAAVTGVKLKVEKFVLRTVGVAMEASALVLGPEMAIAGALVYKAGSAKEWMAKMGAKAKANVEEFKTAAAKKIGAPERIDGAVDKILHWKEAPPKPKPVPVRA